MNQRFIIQYPEMTLKFQKKDIDSLFACLKKEMGHMPEFEQILKDAHLSIALVDAGKPINAEINERVKTLVTKFSPKSQE